MKFCPRSVEILYDDWKAPNVHLSHSFRMYITGFVWAMRCNRNKMAIEKKSEQLKNDLVRFHFLYAEVGTDAQAKGPGESEEDAGFLE